MDRKTSPNKAIFTGMAAALAASSCCIPPVIALIAGFGGASSTLSWMEPLRPYMIGLAVISIGYAWYVDLKPKKADDSCCDMEKAKFYQTKGFLIGITVFATVSIAFPYYSDIFYPENQKEIVLSENSVVRKMELSIDGMTCDACKNHIEHAVNELPGIIGVTASYANANAVVEFDASQTTLVEIEKAINATGYPVTGKRAFHPLEGK